MSITTSATMRLKPLLLAPLLACACASAATSGEDTYGFGSTPTQEELQRFVSPLPDGRGLPPDFGSENSDRLGLQIVRTLVAGELRGTITLHPGRDGGTEAVLVVPLAKR